jgi:hypothetical protein
MGVFGSKPAPPPPPPSAPFVSTNYASATFSAADVNAQIANANKIASDLAAQAKKNADEAARAIGLSGVYRYGIYFLGIVVFVCLIIILYDAFAPNSWPNIFFDKAAKGATPSGGGGGSGVPSSNILYIGYAKYGPDYAGGQTTDVTPFVTGLIQGQTSLPSFTVGFANVGLKTNPYPGKLNHLYVQYYVGTNAYMYAMADDGTPFPTLPAGGSSTAPWTAPADQSKPPVQAPSPPILKALYANIFGSGSGDLSPSFHDATQSAIIQGNLAPLSAQKDGAYGMQWWMYVQDWNYGYGKDKDVVKRSDSTNGAVVNPHITLHPTDNTLRVAVSIFPATEGGSSKAQPAPAGHSGSSEDVFNCDVPNIPLQSWFSVGVTVFGRNLDVYIDGKLVKSCFLSGVPKPSVGDINLTSNGGFSGRICGFNHYPKMLTPSDTSAFYSAGTPCKNKTPSANTSASGYSVKFGVYDAIGKEVQEYTF